MQYSSASKTLSLKPFEASASINRTHQLIVGANLLDFVGWEH